MSNSRAKTLNTAAQKALRSALEVELRQGADLFRAGQYQQALQSFQSLYQTAGRAHAADFALRALSNIGGCEFALHRYRPALKSFLEAHRLAETARDSGAAAVLDANIASLYSAMWDLDSAAEWMQAALDRATDEAAVKQYPKLLIQMATLRAGQKRMPAAMALFGRALDAAERSGDMETYALAWNRLGEELLKQGKAAEAERPLLEAYRIRKLGRLALDSSYRNLGWLRLEQGDLTAASALLDRAVELAERPAGIIPTWNVYCFRGRVRLAQGRLREALADLRIARQLARAWRWSAPEDASRIGAEGWLSLVYSAFIEAGNRLYLQTGDARLMAETFEAAEENRAGSLRALIGEKEQPEAPPAYWEALARLQKAEIGALRQRSERAQDELRAARAELVRLEAAALPDSDRPTEGVLERARATLGKRTALLSFHAGDSISWLWALDREGLALYTLPGRGEMEARVAAARDAIRDDAAGSVPAGAELYQALFGKLPARFRQKEHWLLALDGGLFEAPVAALAETAGPAPVYVVERRTTEVIPGAAVWLEEEGRRRTRQESRFFLGVGDPIYNMADPRLPRVQLGGFWPFRIWPGKEDGGLVMPRLVASGPELDACARSWRGESVLLKGAEAARGPLVAQLRRRPAVAHFATHILESTGEPRYGLMALSLNGRGEMELAPPVEIAHWKAGATVVALSGCHSAAGATLPGAGLLGLTRAWIAAGARNVVGSRWSTPDEAGALFTAFYRNLGNGTGAAEALRAAQLEMLHSAGWRSRPRYWGAYFAVGTD